MKSLLHPLAFAAAAFIAGGPAHASLNPAHVAADARWVVHVDLEALRASAIGQELVAAVEKEQAAATVGGVGLNVAKLLQTIGSLTAYGSNLDKDPTKIDGALIVQGTADFRKIAESLLLQGTIAQPKIFTEDTSFPFPAYAVAEPNSKAEGKIAVVVAFPPEPIVIISKSKDQLMRARDVFRGSAPSLAKTPGSPLHRLGAHAARAYLYAATVVPAENVFPQNAPQTRMLQLAGAGSLALGEHGENTFAHAELVASSSSNADKLAKILQGMTAALSFAETTDKALADFINSTTVARNGDTVTLDLAYSTARLTAMAQSLRKPEAPAAPKVAPITSGRTLAEWTAPAVAGSDSADASHAIENAELKNGATISLGWRGNGGKGVRFQRVEIAPAGGGAPLVFRADMMRAAGRGNMAQFAFPGADGAYSLKVTYATDPEGKAACAVSIRDPKPATDDSGKK